MAKTYSEFVLSIFPNGTVHNADFSPRPELGLDVDKLSPEYKSIVCLPRWPLDVFALTSELIYRNGLSHYLLRLGTSTAGLSLQYPVNECLRISEQWGKHGVFSDSNLIALQTEWMALVQGLWQLEWGHLSQDIPGLNATVVYGSVTALDILESLFTLHVIADEAAKTIQDLQNDTWVSDVFNLLSVEDTMYQKFRGIPGDDWKFYDPSSVSLGAERCYTGCIFADPHTVIVTPKVKTPSLGVSERCTANYLSHLNGKGILKPHFGIDAFSVTEGVALDPFTHISQQFSVLAVPYPFHVEQTDFYEATHKGSNREDVFELEQSWLYSAPSITEIVVDLLSDPAVQAKAPTVLLLPELALDEASLSILTSSLAELKGSPIRLLITGISYEDAITSEVSNKCVYVTFDDGAPKEFIQSEQKKHHKWIIDPAQRKQYALSRLSSHKRYTEDIDIQGRKSHFIHVGKGTYLTAIICEDLARVDPCHTGIRNIGPNIVFALLMDGPQVLGRWPSKTALPLSDDPGSTIMSLTSMGMVKLSNKVFGSTADPVVALIRDKTEFTELTLPEGKRGLLIDFVGKCSLSEGKIEKTLDGRINQYSVNWYYDKSEKIR